MSSTKLSVNVNKIALIRNSRGSNYPDLLHIEGYPSDEFIQLVIDNTPAQVTLVPDPPGALTSDHGWDFVKNKDLLANAIPLFINAGIRVSLFVDADEDASSRAHDAGADRIELYTGPYAHQYAKGDKQSIHGHIAACILQKLLIIIR